MTINVHKTSCVAATSILASRFVLNINVHQFPLIVPLILLFISKEKINVPELMTINVHKTSCVAANSRFNPRE